MATSNGAVLTRDLTNRLNIVRLHKQPQGYRFCRDIKEKIRDRPEIFLGAVFSVVKKWILHEKPRTGESRHSFREWVQSMDWIVQNLFGVAPLMDDYDDIKRRLSDPAATFLRELAIAALRDVGGRGIWTASELFDLAQRCDIAIPSFAGTDETAGRQQIGKLLKQQFSDRDTIHVDDMQIQRKSQTKPRDDGKGNRSANVYKFLKG